MKTFYSLILLILSAPLFAQNPGDTLMIQTFNYTQTNSPQGRDTVIDFPDIPDQTYEKIIMLYNMRCKDGLISVPGNTNRGCGEWDYSCNTYIIDSSRVDSVLSFTNSHSISAFSGNSFPYVTTPLYDYYQYREKNVVINNTISENIIPVGSGNLSLGQVLATENHSGKSQYLFLQSELMSAGLTSGDINGLIFNVLSNGAAAHYLRVRMKATDKTNLNSGTPDADDFTEVYFYDRLFTNGTNRIQFHTPFNWDGTSNLLVEFSFTNNTPDDPLDIEGENLPFTAGLVANNGFNLNSVNGQIDIPTAPFSTISDEITVSFWSYGNENLQPSNNSIVYATDDNNNRTVNIHLPWGNGNVYFDCGNSGGGYDRIDKAATPDEYEGSWSHWAFTKNAATGIMSIYHNGQLWLDGTGKTLPMNIQQMILATSGTADRSYYGKISEFRVWNKELTGETIQNWMYKSLDNTHPDYSNLVAYYPLNEGSGTTVADLSPNAETAQITDYLYWVWERGNQLNRGFEATQNRPNISFLQGNYDLTITDEIVTDSVRLNPNIVRAYEIIPQYGTTHSDSINQISVNEFWASQYVHTFDPEGLVIDSMLVAATDTIEISQLSYYGRYPAKVEIMSFVTPYGIYLDLGMEGKTWAFDVTDYAPVLKGTKRMTIERGGQRQEDMDIRFMYIVGTPPRDVLDFNQIWRADSKNYTDIMDDRAFEPRDFYFKPNAGAYKFRSVITGHGQQGEFTARNHTLNIDGGEVEYEWRVWKECADNAIFPQGGTWIYDRAGWCPGAPSNVYEFDLTEFVQPGETHQLDYGLIYANGASNYIVNNQLITYGAPNFSLDASIDKILKPNSEDASQTRFNPACSYPEIVIQNTGSTPLTSLNIEYFVEGGETENLTWTGSLNFLEKDTVVLPVSQLSFWLGTADRFTVHISQPNNGTDEYPHNNSLTAPFDDIDVYAANELIYIQLKTNNYAYQTSYTLYDGDGNVYFERYDCENNTVYDDGFLLGPGCYQLRIDDSGGNGLDFWAQPAQGTGYIRVKDADGNILHTLDPDFGNFSVFEFGMGNITSISQRKLSTTVNLYPNPTSGKIQLNMEGVSNVHVTATLTNAVMGQVATYTWPVDGNSIHTEIDLSNLSSGIYFLQIRVGDRITTEKIMKY